MIQRTTQKHYNQQKQRDGNLEINSEEAEIDPYHHIARDRDMILLTGAANQEKDQDQEATQGLENTRVQEKLQIKVIMDLRQGMNKEIEVEGRIEEGGTIIKERVQIITIEINLIRIGTEKHRNIIHIQNRPLIRQRIL
jgi:hypothetical protein